MSDEEVFIKLNNIIHVAPCGSLYIEHFAKVVVDNIIDVDLMSKLAPEERYRLEKLLLKFVSDTLVGLKAYEEHENNEDLDKICGRMDGVSRYIKYFGEMGDFDAAFTKMNSFLNDMLAVSDKMFSKQIKS